MRFRHAVIHTEESIDWADGLWAIYMAANQMEDFEDTLQRVKLPDDTWVIVDLDADHHEQNVYKIYPEE